MRLSDRSTSASLLFHVALATCLASAGCSKGLPQQTSGSAKPDSGTESSWFTEITDEVGLDFVHESGGTGAHHMPEIMGAGAALFDYDNDGDLDIYLIQGNHDLPRGLAASEPQDQLYRQEPGGRFRNVTAESGLGDGGYGMGMAIGDIDNDGDLDSYVTNYGPDRLYRNEGNGKFTDITAAAGIEEDGWSASAAFCDYDRDGWLDLYVTHYVEYDPAKPCFDGAGRPDYCSPKVYTPTADLLFHNEGGGRFSDVSAAAGISSERAAGLGVICEDLNEDGWVDFYVANDGYANLLWINQRDGTFRDEALLLGAAYNLNGDAEAGMGVIAADVDGDLDSDLFVTHLRGEHDTLWRNLGVEAGFSDVSGWSGLADKSLPYTGFGTVAFDVELDGDLDIGVVNGRVMRGELLPGSIPAPPWDVYAEPSLFYLNDGTGRFVFDCKAAAAFCSKIEIGKGLATGDIDNDGDLDLLVSNTQGRARLYRNDAPRKGQWLTVRAVDPRYKRDAIGARVTLVFGGRQAVRTISGAFSYLSSSQAVAHFGLGPVQTVDRILVRWPDGLAEEFPGGAADRSMHLTRGEGG